VVVDAAVAVVAEVVAGVVGEVVAVEAVSPVVVVVEVVGAATPEVEEVATPDLPAAEEAAAIPGHLGVVAGAIRGRLAEAAVRGLPEAEHPDPPNYLLVDLVQAVAEEVEADEFPPRPHSVPQAAGAPPWAAAWQICRLLAVNRRNFRPAAIVQAPAQVQAPAIGRPSCLPVQEVQIALAAEQPETVLRSCRRTSRAPAIVPEPDRARVNVPAKVA
jgi:hypothetical protein